MALPRVYRVVQDAAGNVVAGVLCSVLNEGTGVLATLWQDDAGTIPLSNPMTSDTTYGSFGFYVLPGHYDLTFTKPGYVFQSQLDLQVPQDVASFGTMAQQDASAVAITGGSASFVTCEAGNLVSYGSLGVGVAPPAGAGNIRTSGTVGIQRDPSAAVCLFFAQTKATQYGIVIQSADQNTGMETIAFSNQAGTFVGSIQATASATAYNTSSDGRLKEQVEPLRGALATVQRLEPVRFRWKADGSVGHGLVAQAVQAVLPGVVSGDAASDMPMGIDYSKLVPYLIGAVKELTQQVATLTARLEAAGV